MTSPATYLGALVRVVDCKFCGVQDWSATIVAVPSKCRLDDYQQDWPSAVRCNNLVPEFAEDGWHWWYTQDSQNAHAACMNALGEANTAAAEAGQPLPYTFDPGGYSAIDNAAWATMVDAQKAAYEACLKNDPPTAHVVIKAWVADDVYVILTSKSATTITGVILDASCVFRVYGIPLAGGTEQLIDTLDPFN